MPKDSSKPTVHTSRGPEMDEGQAFTNTMPLSRRMLLNKVVAKRRAYLEIEGKGAFSRTVELSDKKYRMGRSRDCEIQLPLNNVSRFHAQIIMRDDEFIVEDLQSTNGSYVNGIQVTWCILRDGDLVEIGEAKLHFFEEKVRQRA